MRRFQKCSDLNMRFPVVPSIWELFLTISFYEIWTPKPLTFAKNYDSTHTYRANGRKRWWLLEHLCTDYLAMPEYWKSTQCFVVCWLLHRTAFVRSIFRDLDIADLRPSYKCTRGIQGGMLSLAVDKFINTVTYLCICKCSVFKPNWRLYYGLPSSEDIIVFTDIQTVIMCHMGAITTSWSVYRC